MTEADVENLVMQLEQKCGGDHAHTAGKARNYLRRFFREQTGFKDGSFDQFVNFIRGAVYRGEWKALDDRMARWW